MSVEYDMLNCVADNTFSNKIWEISKKNWKPASDLSKALQNHSKRRMELFQTVYWNVCYNINFICWKCNLQKSVREKIICNVTIRNRNSFLIVQIA